MSRSLTPLFALALTVVTAVACAPAKNSKTPNSAATHVVTVPNSQAARTYAEATLGCETPNGICPQALALMVSQKVGSSQTELMQCTSFLVSENIMATNSHCIPQDLKAANSSCEGRIQVVFGKTQTQRKAKYECERILSSSAINEDRNSPQYLALPDYAFFRLKRNVNGRRPLRLTREGLNDQTRLRILAIDPVNSTTAVRGIFREKSCATVTNSIATPGYTHAHASVVTLGRCDIIHGNSGSPALDSEGRVRAIVYGLLPPRNTINATNFDLPESFAKVALASNSACISAPAPLQLADAKQECFGQNPSVNDLVTRLFSQAPSRADDLFEAWAAQASGRFGFQLMKATDPSGVEVAYPRVVCMKRKSERTGAAPVDNGQGTSTLDIEAPIWSLRARLDQNYRVSARSQVVDTLKIHLAFETPSLETENAIRVSITSDSARVQGGGFTGRLPTCGVR